MSTISGIGLYPPPEQVFSMDANGNKVRLGYLKGGFGSSMHELLDEAGVEIVLLDGVPYENSTKPEA